MIVATFYTAGFKFAAKLEILVGQIRIRQAAVTCLRVPSGL